MKFDISSVDRIETRRGPGVWRGLLCTAIAIASVAVAHQAKAATPIRNESHISKTSIDGYKTRVMHENGFETVDTPLMNKIKNATVLVTLTNSDWMPIAFGSGALLADHKANGEKTVLSVFHVSGSENIDRGNTHLIISDRNGKILGIANPLLKNVPQKTAFVTADQPVLLAFDPRYPMNKKLLQAIQGLEIANTLPQGTIFGNVTSGVGVDVGASGGPWFNKEGKIIGVSDIMVVTHQMNIQNSVMVYGKNLISQICFPANSKSVVNASLMQKAPMAMPYQDMVLVQGVGAPTLVQALKATSVKPGYNPKITLSGNYPDAFGVGYPKGAPMGYSAHLHLNPILSMSQTKNTSSSQKAAMDNFIHNMKHSGMLPTGNSARSRIWSYISRTMQKTIEKEVINVDPIKARDIPSLNPGGFIENEPGGG